MSDITIIAAFLAGITSFLSPCVLPLIPAFLAYLSGTTLHNAKRKRWSVFLNSVSYVAGFSFVFSLLGVLLNTVLKGISYAVQIWLSRLGGVIIIFFGLYLLGLIRLQFLERDYHIAVKHAKTPYVTSFVFGAAFAFGWTPCVGAVLGSVLALTITQPELSFILLFSYSLGLGLPFLLVGLFTEKASSFIDKLGPVLRYFNIIVGILLIVLGILVFTQTLPLIANLGFVNDILLK